jgi:hypothetical protein
MCNVPQTFRNGSNVPQVSVHFDYFDPVQLPVPVFRPMEDRRTTVRQLETFGNVTSGNDPHTRGLGAGRPFAPFELQHLVLRA